MLKSLKILSILKSSQKRQRNDVKKLLRSKLIIESISLRISSFDTGRDCIFLTALAILYGSESTSIELNELK